MDDYRLNQILDRIINKIHNFLSIDDPENYVGPNIFNRTLIVVDQGLDSLITELNITNIPCSHCYEKYRDLKNFNGNKHGMLNYIINNLGLTTGHIEDDFELYNSFGCLSFDRDIKYLKKK
jgi:hypothetical protein